MGFPKDFLWGVATSAAQIEGALLTMAKVPAYGMYLHRSRVRPLTVRLRQKRATATTCLTRFEEP